MEFDLGPRIFSENNADNIEAIFHLAYSKNIAVNACGSDDLTLFSQVDGSRWIGKIDGAPRFDLDKTKYIAVESDQVDLAGHRGIVQISADRHFEVRSDDSVALLSEKSRCQIFAALSKNS